MVKTFSTRPSALLALLALRSSRGRGDVCVDACTRPGWLTRCGERSSLPCPFFHSVNLMASNAVRPFESCYFRHSVLYVHPVRSTRKAPSSLASTTQPFMGPTNAGYLGYGKLKRVLMRFHH